MPTDEIVAAIKNAETWNSRVGAIRRIPDKLGIGDLADAYSAIAKSVYVPFFAPDFAYVHWKEDYELHVIEGAFAVAQRLTDGFRRVDPESLSKALTEDSRTLRVFRLIIGLLHDEFAAATNIVADDLNLPSVGKSTVRTMERGGRIRDRENISRVSAETIHRAMLGTLFPPAPPTTQMKILKPDTVKGWETIRRFAEDGVPLATFLHQRHYGGALSHRQ